MGCSTSHFARFLYPELKRLGICDIEGVQYPRWSIKSTLKLMKSWNIERVLLSLSLPGVHFGDDAAACRLATKVNDEILSLKKQHGNKLGGLACLPLPDVNGAVAEYERVVSVECLDGVILMSNVNGVYPGNEGYRPLFEKMNVDNAIVFIHPNTPEHTKGQGLTNPFYFWFVDTTKALLSLLTSGFHRDYPNIRYIFAHGGGVVSRLATDLESANKGLADELKNWRSQLYFDTAKFVSAEALKNLRSFTSTNRILFSSDFPWAEKSKMPYWTSHLESEFTDAQTLLEIYRENAKALFNHNSSLPKLGGTNEGIIRQPAHIHAMPIALAEEIVKLGIDINNIQWVEKDNVEQAEGRANKVKQSLPVTLDLPDLWKQPKESINHFIGRYNIELAKIVRSYGDSFSAFGAININDTEAALAQMEFCISSDNISGMCIYPSLNETVLPADEVVLVLSKALLPIIIHPQDSRGAIILNEQKMISTQFMAELLYSGKIDLFKMTSFILAHSEGTHRDIADSLGLLYYLRKKSGI